MEDTIRLFTGLALPAAVSRELRGRLPDWQRRFRFARWTHPDDWHITLHFIGEVPAGRLPAVREALDEAASASAPFRIETSGLDVFGSPRQPSILYVRLANTPPAMTALHAALGSALARRIGFEPEQRTYRPHVTIARKYAGEDRWDPSRLDHERFEAAWTTDEACVFLSRLGRSPMYEIVHRAPLGGGA